MFRFLVLKTPFQEGPPFEETVQFVHPSQPSFTSHAFHRHQFAGVQLEDTKVCHYCCCFLLLPLRGARILGALIDPALGWQGRS